MVLVFGPRSAGSWPVHGYLVNLELSNKLQETYAPGNSVMNISG
jgi:hypothetical protein